MREITLKEMQRIELELLLEFDRLCKKRGLRYYMDGGTLLGAMCYEGFIPWDDDIDLKMPRPDYERFLGLAEELPSHIAVEAPSKEQCAHVFLKLTDQRTLLLEHAGERINESGVYIDILPMDGHPADGLAYEKHQQSLSCCPERIFRTAQLRFPGTAGQGHGLSADLHALEAVPQNDPACEAL